MKTRFVNYRRGVRSRPTSDCSDSWLGYIARAFLSAQCDSALPPSCYGVARLFQSHSDSHNRSCALSSRLPDIIPIFIYFWGNRCKCTSIQNKIANENDVLIMDTGL